MNNIFGICLLSLISAIEVLLLYRVLFYTVVDISNYSLKNKIIIWTVGVGTGVLVGFNREILFFSSLIFLFHISILLFTFCLIEKRNRLIIGSIIVCYFSIVALLDYLWAFLSMIILDESFIYQVHEGVSWEKIMIFSISRGLMIPVIIMLKKRNFLKEFIISYKRILGILSITLVVILIRYQFWMVEMVQFERPINGLEAGASIFTLVSFVLLFSFFVMKSMYFQKENNWLASKDQIMNQHYQELLDGMEKNRYIIHDMKHHIMVLQQYEQKKQYGRLHDYLEKINGELIAAQYPVLTGNRIIDFILNQKRQEAENLGIRFEMETTVFFSQPMDDKELCVLFANLLDNAIEAAKKMKKDEAWISAKIEKMQQMFFIEISNSFSNELKVSNGKILSLKKDKEYHGYGLKSVQRIVEEHEGCFSIRILEKQFVVNISFFSES